MMPAPRSIRFIVPVALVACLALGGCASSPSSGENARPSAESIRQPDIREQTATQAAVSDADGESRVDSCPDARTVRESEKNRAACFHLRPAGTTVVRQGGKTAGKDRKPGTVKEVRVSGRCQPQSLIYARCRTGIMTCRLGDTSPVQWFACARGMKNTTATPVAGSVLVLEANRRRGMPTGHPAYVEEVRANGNGTYTLRISHTNYDRKCHLDQDATVLYDPRNMTANFRTGPWAPWANELKALGFILR